MNYIRKSAALASFVPISDLCDFMLDESARIMKGTKHEGDWYFYHDALSLMTSVECRKYLKNKCDRVKFHSFYGQFLYDSEDLEIQNHRTQSRAGVDDIVSFGMLIQNTSNLVKRHYRFKNMTFKNVYGLYWVDPSDQSAFNGFEVSGLTFKSASAGHIDDTVVED